VDASFLHDGGGAAILVHRIAGEAECLGVATLGHLLVKVVADHAHAVERHANAVRAELALECPHQPEKGRHGRKAVGQRTGNGVGVLDAQTGQHQQALALGKGRAHTPSLVEM
jgi:hypothetical protein